jgi:sugar/nucleoside kinase (ribokinase family)
MVDVISVGYLNIEDTVYPGRPVVPKAPGGGALYFSAAANLWGLDVSIVSRIGENYPKRYLKDLECGGINIENILKLPGPTMAGRTSYQSNGSRKYEMYTPRKRRMELTPLPEDLNISEAKSAYLHLSTIPPNYQLMWAKSFRSEMNTISLDTDISFVQQDQEVLVELMSYVDVFFPNKLEAEAFFAGEGLEETAAHLRSFGLNNVVIKLGEDGAVVYSAQQKIEVPSASADVVDVTGAGDAFAGGFIAGLMETQDIEKAGLRGAVTASMAIEDYGALHLLKKERGEAEQRFDQIRGGD